MISGLLLWSSPGWISHARTVSLHYTLLHRHATLNNGIQVTHKTVNINAICSEASGYEVKPVGLMPWFSGFGAVVDTMVKLKNWGWWGLTTRWQVWSYIHKLKISCVIIFWEESVVFFVYNLIAKHHNTPVTLFPNISQFTLLLYAHIKQKEKYGSYDKRQAV